jgi:hypothetical protein
MGIVINLDDCRPTEPIYGPEPRFDTQIIQLFPEEVA